MVSQADFGYYIGLMSGTSVDGVDGVIIDASGKKILAQACLAYDDELKQSLFNLMHQSKTSLANLAGIDRQVSEFFAKVVLLLLKNSGIKANQINAIGSHGHSVFHAGGSYSMQIGHGAFIAEKSRITTITDFRMQDIAAGGQGAPLTPAYHYHLIDGKDGVVINLGGIANITLVSNDTVVGFDTGPANTLLDNWARRHQSVEYDKNGDWARSGRLNDNLLSAMLADEYFHQNHPKSTGPEYFNLHWLSHYLTGTEQPKDVQRTLVELTAISVSKHIPTGVNVYLCGGGVHNLFLFERFMHHNPHNNILTTDYLGVPTDYVEAAAFGFFAKQALLGTPSSLPLVTGAKGARVLGAVYAI